AVLVNNIDTIVTRSPRLLVELYQFADGNFDHNEVVEKLKNNSASWITEIQDYEKERARIFKEIQYLHIDSSMLETLKGSNYDFSKSQYNSRYDAVIYQKEKGIDLNAMVQTFTYREKFRFLEEINEFIAGDEEIGSNL